jgi:hypothetical protein
MVTLSPAGLQRMHRVLEQRWLSGVRSIFSSCERKARDAASILADHLWLSPVTSTPWERTIDQRLAIFPKRILQQLPTNSLLGLGTALSVLL